MKTPNSPRQYESHTLYSHSGNPLTKFVNLCQTPQERRDKYHFCLFFGLNRNNADRMRDWHWTKINLFLQAFNHTMPLPLDYNEPSGTPAPAP